MSKFAFSLGQKVVVVMSGESGEVIGRGEFSVSENTYLVRYKAADGYAIKAWWGESALDFI